jgi:hypothetical protein
VSVDASPPIVFSSRKPQVRRERTEDLLDLALVRLSNKTATISGNVRSCESNPRWDCRNRRKTQPSSSDADSGGILFALFIRGLATKVASWRANDARFKTAVTASVKQKEATCV